MIAFAFTDYIINGEKHKAKCGLCKNKVGFLVKKKGTTSSFTR